MDGLNPFVVEPPLVQVAAEMSQEMKVMAEAAGQEETKVMTLVLSEDGPPNAPLHVGATQAIYSVLWPSDSDKDNPRPWVSVDSEGVMQVACNGVVETVPTPS